MLLGIQTYDVHMQGWSLGLWRKRPEPRKEHSPLIVLT